MNKEEFDLDLKELNKELRRNLGAREPEAEEPYEITYGEDSEIEIPQIDISETEFDEYDDSDVGLYKADSRENIPKKADGSEKLQKAEEDKNLQRPKASDSETDKNKKDKKDRKRRKNKGGGKKKILFIILGFLVFFIVSVIAVFMVMSINGKNQLKKNKTTASVTVPEEAQTENEGQIVVYNGQKYCYNDNVIDILCMGVDKSIQETSDENIGENGQADVIIMAVLDSETGHLSLINISREAMVDVNQYNVKGKFLGTENMQICLSYAYGDGKERSCMNTAESVSRLLYGMPVHAYAALDLDGIGVLNDAVGGVSVEVLEDLTGSNAALEAGKTVTLTGDLAHTYVRSRNSEVLESNNMRMERQKQYLNAFLQKAISETKSDVSVPLNLYQAAADYMVTDISSSEITYLASLVVKNGISGGDMLTVPGEVRDGGKYAEFIPDDQKLFELILDVFYKKVDEN